MIGAIDSILLRIARGETNADDALNLAPVLTCAVSLAEATWDDGTAWTIINRLRAAVAGMLDREQETHHNDA